MAEKEYQSRLEKTGRNDPCPCGSGKKYKKCHLAEDEEKNRQDRAKADIAVKPIPQGEETEKEEVQNIPPEAVHHKKENLQHGPQPSHGGAARQVNAPRRTGGG